MSPAKVWVITGANRGLGLELVKQVLAQDNSIVVATVRSAKSAAALAELNAGDRLQIVNFSLSDEATFQAAADRIAALHPAGVDVLVNNAASASPEDWLPASKTPLNAYKTRIVDNLVGTLAFTEALLPLLRKGTTKTIVNLSSILGSAGVRYTIGINPGGKADFACNNLPYAVVKAGINQHTLALASELKAEGFTVVSLHPGWVTTQLGNDLAAFFKDPKVQPDIDEATSVKGQVRVINDLTPDKTGSFLVFDGSSLPW